MSETLRQMAARLFIAGDRVRLGDERGIVKAVNVHAAAVVSVQLNGAYNVTPALFTDLTNLTAPRRDAAARTAAGTGTYRGERWNCLIPDRYAG
jgi:hypothetical protein